MDKFDVHALDSLGFGHSEKVDLFVTFWKSVGTSNIRNPCPSLDLQPPLSYNQYLWRDQVCAFVERILSSSATSSSPSPPFILVGNSIGGFTASSAAAVLQKDLKFDGGLVLLNSAGRILDAPGLSETPQEELFLPYGGPPSFLLRIVGKVIFSLLQPQIKVVMFIFVIFCVSEHN